MTGDGAVKLDTCFLEKLSQFFGTLEAVSLPIDQIAPFKMLGTGNCTGPPVLLLVDSAELVSRPGVHDLKVCNSLVV